ncbi:MAG: hypothetical protein ACRC5R_03805 [Mycoplasmatales bacterium]
MKCGYISNNLSNKISNYFNTKVINISYKCETPIDVKTVDKYVVEITNANLDTIIIDSTCFYNEQTALEFCYKVKIENKNIRIIFISFTKQLLSEIAMLGIYDIIYFEKNIKIEEKIDNLLIHTNSLSDISEYLNLDNIKVKTKKQDVGTKESELVVCISLDFKTYQTTTLLELLKNINNNKLTCLIEGPNQINKLCDYFNAYDFATVSDMQKPPYNYEQKDIIFNDLQTWNKTNVLNLLLNVKSKYELAFVDMGYINDLKGEVIKEIIKHASEIIFFDTMSIQRQKNHHYQAIKASIDLIELPKTIINQKEIHFDEIDINKEKYELVVKSKFEKWTEKEELEDGFKIREIKKSFYKILKKDFTNKVT